MSDFIWKELCMTPVSSALQCTLTLARTKLLVILWHQNFFYHVAWKRCKCNTEPQNEELRSISYPMNPPFEFGEITGYFVGWIDEALANLYRLLYGLLIKFFVKKDMFETPLTDLADGLIKGPLMLLFSVS